LHEEQMEIIRMLGDVYALNTVVDEARNLSFINFGEIGASHLAAVRFLEAFCTVTLERRFKTVVTSAAGHPLDQTYYQTVKGMVMPMDILEMPATLIVASSCSEGLGSEAFRASQRRLIANGPERFLQEIMPKQFAEIDEWQSEMQLRSQRIANVQLFTDGLDIEDRALTGVNLIDSVEDAVKASVAATGDPAVAIIPEGPYVVPVYAR
jgi:nickel-dependent lactate racemase